LPERAEDMGREKRQGWGGKRGKETAICTFLKRNEGKEKKKKKKKKKKKERLKYPFLRRVFLFSPHIPFFFSPLLLTGL